VNKEYEKEREACEKAYKAAKGAPLDDCERKILDFAFRKGYLMGYAHAKDPAKDARHQIAAITIQELIEQFHIALASNTKATEDVKLASAFISI